jgi:hypothetical protein
LDFGNFGKKQPCFSYCDTPDAILGPEKSKDMPDECQNTISTPELPGFKAAISPFLKTRYIRVQEYIDYGTHGDNMDVILPSGIPRLRLSIELDFEKIIPMPEPIQRTRREEFCELGPRGKALREENYWKFGFKDWYDWSSEHWGTKWNSYHGRFVENETAFFFSTAWDPPFPIVRKLAELLNSPVQLEYFDYDIEGRALFQPNGEMEDSRHKW